MPVLANMSFGHVTIGSGTNGPGVSATPESVCRARRTDR